MGGLFSFLSRKKTKNKDNNAAQPLAAAGQPMASQIGNQAMLDLVSPKRPAGGVKMAGADELEEKIRANLPALRAAREMAEMQNVPESHTHGVEMAGADELGEKVRANLPALRAAQEMSEMQNVPEMARTSLSELYTQLKTSKRGGIFTSENSEYYEAVMSSLRSINTAMNQGFSQDAKENQKKLIDMEHRYQELIDACAAYTARDPWSRAGKHRKELVTMIQTRASTDLVALGAVRTDFCALPPQEQSGKNWNELLDQSRTIRLSVENYAELGKATGGQASEVYQLKGSNTKVKNAAGESVALNEMHFFKAEDEFDMKQATVAARVVENVLARYSKLTKKDKQLIREWAANPNGDMRETAKAVMNKLSEDGKIALDAIKNNLNGAETTSEQIVQNLGIAHQDKINMTRRNVATSRVAELLGIGNLVAKSETAELYDEKTGHTIRGNLMEKARGSMSAKDFLAEPCNERNDNSKDVKVNTTGGFQRDLCNLQVLDVICGQIDRHEGNYFISQNEKGELSGIQGIDNDASFGTDEAPSLAKNKGGKQRAIFDIKTGKMTLPYMDKNLAERIKQLDPDMLRFALKDLLKNEEIEAAVKRLEHTKKAIETTQQEEPERFLEDNQWNDDTAQEMITNAWDCNSRLWNRPKGKSSTDVIDDTALHENYFGRLMIASLTNIPIFKIGEGDAPQLLRRKNRA